MRRIVMLGVAAVTLAACGGSDSTSPRWINLAVAQPTLAITQGQQASMQVNVTRLHFEGDVSLSVAGMPDGVTAHFQPATLTGGATSSTLTFAVTAKAAPGTAVIAIDAEANGVEWQHSTVALTVKAAPKT